MPKSKTSLEELLYDVRRIAENREKLTEEKIAAIYQDLMDNLEKFVGQQYKKFADSDGRLYISYLDAQRKRAKFLQEIVDNVEGLSLALKEEMETLIDITYKDCFQGMSKALLEADGAGLLETVSKDVAANPNVLRQSLKNNISKLTLTPMMEKYRNEITYKIQQELTIGLMQGDRYEQMARRIEQQIDVSYNRAKLIARTEAHRNVETGFMDCAEHIQEGLDGSELIYAATWRTMKDERVRPNRRIKTKHGWKIVKGKGANHQKMEGVTVKAGEMFDLGDGVKAKAPSESGVAAHDCNCRCFLEYNLMTVEEFAKATNQTEEQVRKKYKIGDTRENESTVKEKTLTESKKSDKMSPSESVRLQLSDYPEAFTKGAEGKNTQKLIDFVNDIEGADPNALKLYSCMGKLESVPFKISHAQGNAITYRRNRITGELSDVKITIPKFKGDNISGQVNTTLHEEMHLMDLFGAENGKWYSARNQKLVDVFNDTSAEIGDDILKIFQKHDDECVAVRKAAQKAYDDGSRALRDKYLPNGMAPWENPSGYREYEKEAKKLLKQVNEDIDYNSRNVMGGGICSLQDIYDALSGGQHRANGIVRYGHGTQYYSVKERRVMETIANYASLSVTRPDLVDMLRKDKPGLCDALDDLIQDFIEKAGG